MNIDDLTLIQLVGLIIRIRKAKTPRSVRILMGKAFDIIDTEAQDRIAAVKPAQNQSRDWSTK